MARNRYQDKIIPNLGKLDPVNMQNCIQHLAKEHGFMESVFNTINEAVMVIDDMHRIVYHNDAAKSMLGLPDELSRLTIDKILKGVNWETLLPSVTCETKSDGMLRQELEIFYPEHRIVQLYALPLVGTHTSARWAVILNDVTSTLAKAASDAENERTKLISMLAAGVAHEIGNPLNSLYLHLQIFQKMLEGGNPDLNDLLEETKEARSEVERLDSIITEFLHALRPGKLNLEPLDLRTLVLEALNFMRHEIAAREIKVDFMWDDGVPLIRGDQGQLKQAFYNLAENAIQSMKKGGHLGIRCTADGDYVLLSISDTGYGIPKGDLSKIFTPYFTTKGSGTGLGLMIVDRIVRDHGASLSVESTEGEGTTFTIGFPRLERTVKVLPPPEQNDEKKD